MSRSISMMLIMLVGTFLIWFPSDSFLFPTVRHHATTTTVMLPLSHYSWSRSTVLQAKLRVEKEGRGRGGGQRRDSSKSKTPRKPDDFLENTKWGRIQSPQLFELFDPSANDDTGTTTTNKNTTIIQQRTLGLEKVQTERFLTTILNSWAKSRRAPDAAERCHEVLKHLILHDCHLRPDVFLYNVVLNAYARRKNAAKANNLLMEMVNTVGGGVDEQQQQQPDVRSFSCVMNAWTKSNAKETPERCKELLDKMNEMALSTGNKELAPNIVTYTTVIDAYAARGRAQEAEEIFREMLKASQVEPNVRTFSCLMKAWSKSDSDEAPERCKELLEEMSRMALSTGNMDLAANLFTYSSVIDAFASRGRAKEAEEVLREMLKESEVKPDVVLFNCVMNAWVKSNSDEAPERCKGLLEEMNQVASSTGNKKLVPDIITYTTLIDAYAGSGRAQEAEEVLREMLKTSRVEPNVRMFNCVMNAWSKSDADDEAPVRCKELLNEMNQRMVSVGNKKKKLAADIVTYTTVIDAYASRGRAKEAEEVLREMMMKASEGSVAVFVEPNEVVVAFNSVMNAWSKSDSDDDAPERCKELLEEMMMMMVSVGNNNNKKKLAPNTATYRTLIDAYARRGREQEGKALVEELLLSPNNNDVG